MNWQNDEQRDAFESLVRRFGTSEAAERWLLRLGLDLYLAAQPPVSTVAEDLGAYQRTEARDAESNEALLRVVLERFGLKVRRFRPGRPATAAVFAKHHPIEVADWEVYGEEPLVFDRKTGRLVSVVFATDRVSRSAAYSLRPPTDDDSWEAVIFVLVSEQRGWLVTRGELLEFYETLCRKERVLHFGLDRKRGTLRAHFPKKEVGYDLAQRLRVNG